ncbi:MAG TPA: right-handed parallel beta-helix repeat-containing protein [Allosphingosinicella sp.]|nr:right-handed parallel beta-helix repeat-containing protein [Allosphingosinicella sp.]
MNISKRIALVGTVVAASAFGYAAPASAQATRTWVSGVGDDVNPCSRTAPCKTFAGAISKTAAGGEINCLDPGGFGAVTIIKSMTISCPYTEGGALAGGNGVVVNLPAATDVVFLRGLDLFGVNPPSNGVRFIAQGTLHIEDCVIRRFNAASSAGVSFAPSAAGAKLFISNTTIAENGNAATGGGIVIKPGASGSGKVVLNNVRVHNNANVGLQVDSTGSSGAGIFVSLENSSISGNASNGVHALRPVGTQGILITINSTLVVNNGAVGLLGDGAGATMRVGDSTIAGNVTGISRLNASQIVSYGDNRLNGNSSADGTFFLPNIPKL